MAEAVVRIAIDARPAVAGSKEAAGAFDRLKAAATDAAGGSTAIEGAFSRIKTAALAMGGVMAAAFAVKNIVGFGKSSYEAGQAAAKGQALLASAIANTGRAWEDSADQIREHAGALWDSHRLTEGEIHEGMRRLISVTGDYEASLQNVGLAADIAAARNISLEAASDIVGKALTGNVAGLKKLGIEVSDSGDAIEQLTERFGGMAAAGTTGGEAIGKAWGDFKEAIGGALATMGGGEPLLGMVADRIRDLTEWVGANSEAFARWGAGIGAAGSMGVAFAKMLFGVWSGVFASLEIILAKSIGGVLTVLDGAASGVNLLIRGVNRVTGASIQELGGFGSALAAVARVQEDGENRLRRAIETTSEARADAVDGAGRLVAAIRGEVEVAQRAERANRALGSALPATELQAAADAAKAYAAALDEMDKKLAGMSAARVANPFGIGTKVGGETFDRARWLKDKAAAEAEEARRERFAGAGGTLGTVDAAGRQAVRDRLKDIAAEAERNSKLIEEFYGEAARGIQRAFADGFRDLFAGNLSGFRDFADKVLDLFSGLAADIAAAMASEKLGLDKILSGELPGGLKGAALKYGGGAAVGFGAGMGSGNPAMGMLSGAASGFAMGGAPGAVLGAVGGLVGGLLGHAKTAREAARAMDEAMADWARSLQPPDLKADAFQNAKSNFERATGTKSNATTPEAFSAAMKDWAKDVDKIFGKDEGARFRAALALFEKQMAQAADAIAAASAKIGDSLEVELLRASGDDAAAEALALRLAREEALAEMARNYPEWVDKLKEVHALQDELIAKQKAQREEEAAKAEAAAAAARALSIAVFDLDIAAQSAALAGRDLEAMQLAGEAALLQQIDAWAKLVEEGKLTEEQLTRLAELFGERLARDIEKAAEAAERARAAFADVFDIDELMGLGKTGEADALRREVERRRRIQEALDLGLDEAFIDRINAHYDRLAAAVEGATAAAADAAERAAKPVDRLDDAMRAEVSRSLRGVTEVSVMRLADYAAAQLNELRGIHAIIRAAIGGRGLLRMLNEGLAGESAFETSLIGDARR
jgi:hypothetical protein